ncbi:ABC transporter permease [Umezawaea sp. Da 62-37]|uniref:ABC transporter permease n=1 Tax=Umezawaea sp. Da 62-37 TaxID=3075927 RepID=UPI0028F6D1FB|nr:ABC transporter permease [Umezawaea sp. Da 62-37]WNV84076.1 ABC transporter permease [Umezawaea sp. Da 62-37]
MRLSGRFRSSLIIGGQGIRARKMRTFLSMLSLFLGVLAVVTVQAGSVIAQRAMLSDVEITQGKDGTVQMYLPSDPRSVPVAMDVISGRTDAVGVTRGKAVIGEPGVKPLNEGGGRLDQGGGYGPAMRVTCDANGCKPVTDEDAGAPQGQAIELAMNSLTGDIRQFRPFRLQSGEWLDFSSAPSLSPRIVLNKYAAEGFANHEIPAEMRVSGAVANATPRIIGVVDDGGWGPAAYVRSDELLNWMPVDSLSDQRYGSMELMLAPTATDLQQTLRTRLVAAGANGDEIHVETINSLEEMQSQLALMRWIFLGMAAMVLLIGVAGILNVGLATVGERIEEFALRRAVGTPRLLLAGIVLAETLLTGLLTAAAAIGFGIVGLKAVSSLLGSREPFLQNVDFPWQAGVAGVIAGLIAGILGGLIPAIRAARIPIATVMRA